MGRGIRGRLPALLALALPTSAGLAYLYFAGAPQHYVMINGIALAIGLLLAGVLRAPAPTQVRRFFLLAMIAALFIPLVTGPTLDGVSRWIPLGPFQLHSGSLLLPPILALMTHHRNSMAPILLACIFAGLLQPDAAIGFAIVFAAVGLHDVTRDWRLGLVCILGFLAALVMAVRGNPPPQEFVERVLVSAGSFSLAMMSALFLSLVACFFLILRAIPAPRSTRFALAGSLFGFTILSLMNNYPSVLIGYGAAPILGYGLALGLAHTARDEEDEIDKVSASR